MMPAMACWAIRIPPCGMPGGASGRLLAALPLPAWGSSLEASAPAAACITGSAHPQHGQQIICLSHWQHVNMLAVILPYWSPGQYVSTTRAQNPDRLTELQKPSSLKVFLNESLIGCEHEGHLSIQTVRSCVNGEPQGAALGGSDLPLRSDTSNREHIVDGSCCQRQLIFLPSSHLLQIISKAHTLLSRMFHPEPMHFDARLMGAAARKQQCRGIASLCLGRQAQEACRIMLSTCLRA